MNGKKAKVHDVVSVEKIHDSADRPVVRGRALVRPVAVYPGVLHQRALVHHHVVDLAGLPGEGGAVHVSSIVGTECVVKGKWGNWKASK